MAGEWVSVPPFLVLPPDVPAYGLTCVLSDGDAVRNNLAWGNAAVRFTKSKIFLGAANKPEDMLMSQGRALVCIMQIYDEIAALKTTAYGTDYWRKMARIASARGCGNCGEQTAVAFDYLYGYGVRPLDIMQIDGADHQFLLIGRNSIDKATGRATAQSGDITTWGPRCVVVDPHKDRVHKGSEIEVFKGVTLGIPGGPSVQISSPNKEYRSVHRVD